jgi:thiol-disulfide isomerase/thioredoxin
MLKYFLMKIIATLTICCGFLFCQGQPNAKENLPEIGKPLPDFFFKSLIYFTKNQASLLDFRDKWLVLDFWSTGCVSCVESFPKINKIQIEFKDRLQFLMIGWDDKYIRPTYEKLRQRYDLKLALAYDTLLFKRFGIYSVPRIIIVDRNGIVRAITSSSEITEENMEALISGKQIEFAKINGSGDFDHIDFGKPILTNGNGEADTDFLYRSLLSRWKPSISIQMQDFSEAFNWSNYLKTGIQETGLDLNFLYRIAFSGYYYFTPYDTAVYGRFWPSPVLETRDSSAFVSVFHGTTVKNIYCYSLIVPPEKATNKNLQELMQKDLKNYFGFEVSLENRKMPYWRLTASDSAKIKLLTKGGAPDYPTSKGSSGFILKNMPIRFLIGIILNHHAKISPILDETGLEGNIDITIDALVTNFDELLKSLKKNGLDLIRSEKIMKVIVIRDKKE